MARLWKIVCFWLVLASLAVLAASPSSAQSGEPIRVEVGKTSLLRMDERPEVIFIGNPAIVDIVVEQGGVMFLVGRQTGETNMHLLDVNGETIMNAIVVVTPQNARHMTLHRGQAEATYSCNPRCAGVRNPHAAGASIAGANQNIGRDSRAGGEDARAQDAAVTAAAAAAAATTAAAQKQQEPAKPDRPAYAPLNR